MYLCCPPKCILPLKEVNGMEGCSLFKANLFTIMIIMMILVFQEYNDETIQNTMKTKNENVLKPIFDDDDDDNFLSRANDCLATVDDHTSFLAKSLSVSEILMMMMMMMMDHHGW